MRRFDSISKSNWVARRMSEGLKLCSWDFFFIGRRLSASNWIAELWLRLIQSGPKIGPHLQVCNSCVWWHRKVFHVSKMFGCLSWV